MFSINNQTIDSDQSTFWYDQNNFEEKSSSTYAHRIESTFTFPEPNIDFSKGDGMTWTDMTYDESSLDNNNQFFTHYFSEFSFSQVNSYEDLEISQLNVDDFFAPDQSLDETQPKSLQDILATPDLSTLSEKNQSTMIIKNLLSEDKSSTSPLATFKNEKRDPPLDMTQIIQSRIVNDFCELCGTLSSTSWKPPLSRWAMTFNKNEGDNRLCKKCYDRMIKEKEALRVSHWKSFEREYSHYAAIEQLKQKYPPKFTTRTEVFNHLIKEASKERIRKENIRNKNYLSKKR